MILAVAVVAVAVHAPHWWTVTVLPPTVDPTHGTAPLRVDVHLSMPNITREEEKGFRTAVTFDGTTPDCTQPVTVVLHPQLLPTVEVSDASTPAVVVQGVVAALQVLDNVTVSASVCGGDLPSSPAVTQAVMVVPPRTYA